ncbi:MAG: flagellar hook protein FlgE [Caulobacter sp.]|nr:flagellar hook protein FlgE [Caulobacter sp.]
MQVTPTAAAGLLDAAGRFDASARRTAAAPLDNLEREIVARVQAVQDVKANAAVIRAADRMTGTVLDMLA